MLCTSPVLCGFGDCSTFVENPTVKVEGILGSCGRYGAGYSEAEWCEKYRKQR